MFEMNILLVQKYSTLLILSINNSIAMLFTKYDHFFYWFSNSKSTTNLFGQQFKKKKKYFLIFPNCLVKLLESSPKQVTTNYF